MGNVFYCLDVLISQLFGLAGSIGLVVIPEVPLLLFIVLIPLAGLGIGLFKRLMNL